MKCPIACRSARGRQNHAAISDGSAGFCTVSVDGSQLGAGYGRPTPAGLAAIERLAPFAGALDTTYEKDGFARFDAPWAGGVSSVRRRAARE